MEASANVSQWVLRTVRERIQDSGRVASASIQRGVSHSGGPRAGSGNGTRSNTLLRKEAIEVSLLLSESPGSQPILHRSEEGWGLASNSRSTIVEPLSQETQVQDAYYQASRGSNQVRGLVVTIDLKDAYFHISILPQHRKFLRFALGGKAYQYRVLPFGLALSPRTFTKCVDAALAPLRLQGIRILNYIDDWLILAQSEQVAVRHRDVVLAHMRDLGLRLNAKKSVLPPVQKRTTYLGVVWDSTTMQARLSPARIESILATVKRVREGQSLTVKQFQRLLGLMAAASNVITFWPAVHETLASGGSGTTGFSPRGNPFRIIRSRGRCLRALDMWKNIPDIPVTRPRVGGSMSSQNANDGRLPHGLGSGHEWPLRSRSVGRSPSQLAHQLLEMLAVFQALKHFLPDLGGHHVLVRTDNTSVVSYINHQGGLRSRPLYRLARQILLWAQGKLLSLRVVYIREQTSCRDRG